MASCVKLVYDLTRPELTAVKKYPPKSGLRGTLIQSRTQISFLCRALPSNERDLSLSAGSFGEKYFMRTQTALFSATREDFKN